MADILTPQDPSIILQAIGISKHFGGVQALKEVSISACAGEITGLIGPNGAGKSTLLAILGGDTRPDAGQVLLAGVDFVGQRRGSAAQHGLVRTFQQASPIPNMTVLENVMLGGSQRIGPNGLGVVMGTRRLRTAEASLRDDALSLLAQLELTGLENRLAADLSFGQLRLLEICRALMAQPKVLLLDEPVAGLNSVETAHLGQVLADLVDGGLAILLVDHDIPFMLGLCKVVFVLDYGEMIASGAPEAVERNPLVRAAYLGDEEDPGLSGEDH